VRRVSNYPARNHDSSPLGGGGGRGLLTRDTAMGALPLFVPSAGCPERAIAFGRSSTSWAFNFVRRVRRRGIGRSRGKTKNDNSLKGSPSYGASASKCKRCEIGRQNRGEKKERAQKHCVGGSLRKKRVGGKKNSSEGGVTLAR